MQWPPPPQYAAPYGAPMPGYGPPPAYAAPPPYVAPPRRWHAPFALDAHMDERTDVAIARALGQADVATLRGFAQAIERVYPVGAGVLRGRAWQLEQAAPAPPAPQYAPPARPVAPPPAAFDPTAQPPAPREQVANYAQLLTDMVASGAAEAAAAAPPPPAVKVEALAPAPKPRRRVVSVSHAAENANGAAAPSAPPAPSPSAAPAPPVVS